MTQDLSQHVRGAAKAAVSTTGRAAFLTSLAVMSLVTVTLTGCAGVARAEEGSGSAHFSWSWNIGNRIHFGNENTKGSGVVKEETRAVANFSKLVLALPATVTLTQGGTESLTISADDNILPLLTTRVDGDELIVEGDRSRGFFTKNEIKIRLNVKNLSGVNIRGSGDVIGDQIKGDKLEIAIAGSGDVKFASVRVDHFKIGIAGSGDVVIGTLDSKVVDTTIRGSGDIRLPSVQASQVTISVNGSGDVFAAGNTDKVDIEIRGSGDVRTKKLIAREASVKVVASGDADVYAKEKLTASVSGSGDIRYAGSPANVSRSVKGSGSIEAM